MGVHHSTDRIRNGQNIEWGISSCQWAGGTSRRAGEDITPSTLCSPNSTLARHVTTRHVRHVETWRDEPNGIWAYGKKCRDHLAVRRPLAVSKHSRTFGVVYAFAELDFLGIFYYVISPIFVNYTLTDVRNVRVVALYVCERAFWFVVLFGILNVSEKICKNSIKRVLLRKRTNVVRVVIV